MKKITLIATALMLISCRENLNNPKDLEVRYSRYHQLTTQDLMIIYESGYLHGVLNIQNNQQNNKLFNSVQYKYDSLAMFTQWNY